MNLNPVENPKYCVTAIALAVPAIYITISFVTNRRVQLLTAPPFQS